MRFLAVFFLTMLLSVPAWAAQVIEGKVVGISDGDTITVLTAQKQQVKVRLYGVDCPESKQAYGSRARQRTSGYVFNKQVRVQVMDTDRYGRTVGIVTTTDGATLNRELLQDGMAWLYTAYCKAPVCNDWKRVEESARRSRTGLWADASPTAPWQFRKTGRTAGKVQSSQPSFSEKYVVPSGGYSGNTSSGIFHGPGCRYYNCKRCTAHFPTREAAVKAGFRPCKVCRP